MNYTIVKLTVITSLLCFAAAGAFAQQTLNDFGKNRVQYKNFNWRYLSSDNFDIYFYDEGEFTARVAAKYLEKEFERITDMLGYAPYSKTKIFLYNSVKDLQQSNVGVNENNFTIGGQTNFVKSQVEIAYPGNMSQFKEDLVLEISDMLINDMMFGGSLTDMFQSAYLLSLPQWFVKGAAKYIAEGWSVEMDDYMRDLPRNQKNIKLTKFSGKDAALIGQSVWNFIAIKYGKSSISNILNLVRIIRNEENSIVNTLGVPYKLFLKQWESFYGEMNTQISDSYVFLDKDVRLRNNNRKSLEYNDVRFSPDGKFIAYSENYKGKYKVYIENVKTGKKKRVHTSGYKVINQEVDYSLPLLNWRNNTTLGIIGAKRGENYLWLYSATAKNKQQKILPRFNQIKGFDFNDNGRLAVISGDYNGQNDLFMYNPDRNTTNRISTDIYDDLNPRFLPGTNTIVFASNRPNDSLIYVDNTKVGEIDLTNDIGDNFNIFMYDADQSDTLLSRVTNTISRDIMPVPKDETSIFYLSDQRGIFNIYKYDLPDSLFNQVSDFGLSIKDYDINFETGNLAFIMIADGKDFVHLIKGYDFSKSTFTPKTQREDAIQVKLLSQRLAEKRQQNNLAKKPEMVESVPQQAESPGQITRQQPAADSAGNAVIEVMPDSLQQNNVLEQEPVMRENVTADTIPADPDYIDTDNYVFDSDPDIINTDNYTFSNDTAGINADNYNFQNRPSARRENTNSFLARYRKLQKETQIYGPLPYETRFSADNIVTSLAIDPLRGFGFQMEAQMNDMLENHKFYGGLLAITNLRSSTVFAEYQYLKNRIDYRVRFQRDAIFKESNSDLTSHKYLLNQFEVGASLPINTTTRLEVNPFYANTQYYDLDWVSITPLGRPNTESYFNYAGVKAGIVFDNTLINGLNSFEGTRAKATFTRYQGINDAEKSFSNITVDIRNYQKIHRELVFATRLYYGTFFGEDPKRYLLGGMNNWLFNQTDTDDENDPIEITRNVDNSDLLFLQYAPLRGFNYNKYNGSSVLTFSAELRFPVIRYFFRGPIASNFFRNLEFIGFYDAGSAWTGNSPFSEENSLNTEIVENEGSPFRIEIKNFKNPWLMSYGAGIRTVLLGYYLKFDMAYPIEDNIIANKPRFYLTLGYDF